MGYFDMSLDNTYFVFVCIGLIILALIVWWTFLFSLTLGSLPGKIKSGCSWRRWQRSRSCGCRWQYVWGWQEQMGLEVRLGQCPPASGVSTLCPPETALLGQMFLLWPLVFFLWDLQGYQHHSPELNIYLPQGWGSGQAMAPVFVSRV